MKKAYIINGLPRSGKDTFAEFLGEYCKVKKISAIDPVVKIIKNAGLDVSNKTEADRTLMSELKESLDKWGNVSTKYIMTEFGRFLKSDNDVLLIDVRNPMQIQEIFNIIEVRSVFIYGGKKLDNPTAADDENVITAYNYDYYIDNTGTLKEYKNNVLDFYNSIVCR